MILLLWAWKLECATTRQQGLNHGNDLGTALVSVKHSRGFEKDKITAMRQQQQQQQQQQSAPLLVPILL